MARASNADIAIFGLDLGAGNVDYLAWLKSSNFDWDITLEECSGIATRHPAMVETKRALTFSAEMNRRASSGGACMTAKGVTTLTFDGTDYLASFVSVDSSYTNANSRSDGAADTLATVQLHRPTVVSGTIELMVDQATATWLTTLIDAGESVAATFVLTDAVGTETYATYLNKVGKSWPESGLIMQTLGFSGGTVSGAGGGLYAVGLTGSGEVDFLASDGADNVSGTAVILSASKKVARDGRTTESYSFHVNAVADEAA